MTNNFSIVLENAVKSIRTKTNFKPSIGVILGSGLSEAIDSFGSGIKIDYSEIDGFPKTTVAGHKGFLYISEDYILFAGRFHYYEGHSMDNVVLPTFFMKELGVKQIVVTNAAGAINTNYELGELVFIKDHINMLGTNPLIGLNNDKLGPRFFDMTDAYTQDLRNLGQSVYKKLFNKDPNFGVYAAMTGPSYETVAEINMLKVCGADLVGMSTVPEVIAAHYGGIKVIGISCVTNYAAGISKTPLNHNEVMEIGAKVRHNMVALLKGLMAELKNR